MFVKRLYRQFSPLGSPAVVMLLGEVLIAATVLKAADPGPLAAAAAQSLGVSVRLLLAAVIVAEFWIGWIVRLFIAIRQVAAAGGMDDRGGDVQCVLRRGRRHGIFGNGRLWVSWPVARFAPEHVNVRCGGGCVVTLAATDRQPNDGQKSP